MNPELKKIIQKVKAAQTQMEKALKNQTWLEDARKYAEKQSKDVKKLLAGDVAKVKTFLEKERKELEKFQKQIPGELEKFRKYVNGQKKELEKLLKKVRKAGGRKPGSKAKSSRPRRKSSKKTSA